MRLELVEVFREFRPVIEGRGNRGRYRQLFEVVLKPEWARNYVSYQDVHSYVRRLQERYPHHGFYARTVHIRGKPYVLVTRRAHWRDAEGRLHEVQDRVSIYIDVEEQRFYVPRSHLQRRPKLVSYVVMRVLGGLGVAKVRYIGMRGLVVDEAEPG